MQEIKRIDIISLAKIEAVLGGVIGLIAGIIFAVVGTAFMGVAEGEPGSFALLFGLTAVIILPILYAAVGFVAGLIVAFVYNVIAGLIGGIKIELV